METKTYTLQILKEHLLTNDYLQLSPDTAKNRMEDLKNLLKKLIYDNKTTLPSTEHQSSTASRKYTNNQWHLDQLLAVAVASLPSSQCG